MIEHFCLAILRRCYCGLLLALGLVMIVPRADAVGPGLLDYFHECGIGHDAFAKFADDRQIADEEFDVIRRIAVRLRDCPAVGQVANLSCFRPAGDLPQVAGRLSSPAEAKGQRGQRFEFEGSIVSVESVEDQGGEPLWRCSVKLDRSAGVTPASSDYPRRAVVYVADVAKKLRAGGAGQRVAVAGVFVKYVPAAEPTAVFVASRLQWRAEPLWGNLEMDFGLFEGISDNSSVTAADRDAFYRLLLLARGADPDRLNREADPLIDSSPGLAAIFRDPAAHRGCLVKLSGTARRVVRVPIDDPAIVSRLGTDHYFEIDFVAGTAENNPLVFCTLNLPDGVLPGGPPSYGENMEVTGFFLKNWQYPTALSAAERAAHPGSSQALQTAPLVIGGTPLWKPAAAKKSSSGAAVGGLLALVIAGVCLLLWSFRQSDQDFFRQVIARQ